VSSLSKWSSAAKACCLAISAFPVSSSLVDEPSLPSSCSTNWCSEKSEASPWLTAISLSPYSNSSDVSSGSCLECFLLLLIWRNESVESGVSSLSKWSSAAKACCLAISAFPVSSSLVDEPSLPSSCSTNWCSEKSEESPWLTAISLSPYSKSSPASSGSCLERFLLLPLWMNESVVSGVSSLSKWSSAAIACCLAISAFPVSSSLVEEPSLPSSCSTNWCSEKSEESPWLTAISLSPYSKSSDVSSGSCLELFLLLPFWRNESVVSGMFSLSKWSSAANACCLAISALPVSSSLVDEPSLPSSCSMNWCREKSEESPWLTAISLSPYSKLSDMSSGSCLECFCLRRDIADAASSTHHPRVTLNKVRVIEI